MMESIDTFYLIEYYLKNNIAPASSGRLNSMRKNAQMEEQDANHHYMKFEIKIPGSKIALIKKLLIIKNCKKLNIKSWIENFLAISKSLEWSFEDQKIVLHEVVQDSYLKDGLDKKNTTEIIKQLNIRVGYKMDSSEFIHRLKFIRQKDFESIQEFYQETKINFTQYANIENVTPEEHNRRLKEYFFNNLSFYTKRRLKDLRIFEIEEALTCLTN